MQERDKKRIFVQIAVDRYFVKFAVFLRCVIIAKHPASRCHQTQMDGILLKQNNHFVQRLFRDERYQTVSQVVELFHAYFTELTGRPFLAQSQLLVLPLGGFRWLG